MQCQAKHREKKGDPWVRCTAEATTVLSWGTKPNVKAYCTDDAQRFIEIFPRGTFREVKIGKAIA